MSPATGAACAVLAELVSRGLRHIVVSPGSRSQALALAAAELERLGRIRMHVRTDERSAAFTALGIGRETGVPAALVCTSGTAPANYLPAVLEAHHAGVPLLLLTADRPPELRGIGANQTTDQVGMFGGSLRFSADAPTPEGGPDEADEFRMLAAEAFRGAVGGARGVQIWWTGTAPAGSPERPQHEVRVHRAAPGPAQLNLPFREPLAGALPAGFGVRSGAAGRGGADASLRVGAAASRADGLAAGTDSLGDEPFGPAGSGPPAGDATAGDDQLRPARPGPLVLGRGPRTVVLAGADAGPAAVEAARAAGWPLLAEIVSGARTTADAVPRYRFALRDPELGGRIERVVVFGHPTLNREETALLSRADVDVVAVPSGGERLNLNGATRDAMWGVEPPLRDANDAWLAAWERWSETHTAGAPAPSQVQNVAPTDALSGADRTAGGSDGVAAAGSRAAADAGRGPDALDREALVAAVWEASGPDDRLMFGSSRLVRVADDTLPPRDVRVHANRGLAGIDGTIATGIGIALASQDQPGAPAPAVPPAPVTRVLLGDLAFLHDAGSMLLPDAERPPRIQVIVGNDGGGTIFDGLEVAAVAGRAAMDRVQYTPQSADLASLAAAYGWAHTRAGTEAELRDALAAPPHGPHLVEVPLAR
ncbi:thiamine pyrophosphate-binding protein [Microbacterium halophytorum]|uniref:thiamine pyrophosphate-binding protein n=1 Tax=Microbacterium halophytorum TaxID=2067568 RepID=UPI001572CE9D|nr:thiamine pyrophosphate-binding protein [Microbacterium halophytorum]